MASNYGGFVSSLSKFQIQKPIEAPESLPEMPESIERLMSDLDLSWFPKVPENLDELLKRPYKVTTTFKGGETKGL